MLSLRPISGWAQLTSFVPRPGCPLAPVGWGLALLALLILNGCGSGSGCGSSGGYQADDLSHPGLLDCSSSSSSSAAMSGTDPGNQAALSNALTITSGTASTGTGAMAKFAGPLNAYEPGGTNGVAELMMPATATAKGGLQTVLTLNPTVSNLVPYCDVGSSSAYSYWVAGPTPGESVAGATMTLVITWPPFSTTGTIGFRCSGVLSNSANPATNSAVETTIITATP